MMKVAKALVYFDFLYHQSEISFGYLSVQEELPCNFPGHIDIDGEAQSLRPANDGRIDPDHFAVGIDERAAGIAGIERGVGLRTFSITWPVEVRKVLPTPLSTPVETECW